MGNGCLYECVCEIICMWHGYVRGLLNWELYEIHPYQDSNTSRIFYTVFKNGILLLCNSWFDVP